MTWVLDLVRQLLSVFDRIVYGLIEVFYTAFNMIAKTRVFLPETLDNFAIRIYVFLAIIMLFKLSFSIITYIINPDNFTNNEKGLGKLIQNIIIVMVLIVLTPKIFEQAYNLQGIVLKENVIGQIILGSNSTEIVDDKETYKAMSFTVLNAFLKPNTKEIGALSTDDYGNVTCNSYRMPTTEEINSNSSVSGQGNINDKLPFVKCMNNLSTQQTNIIDDDGVSHPGTGIGATYVWATQKQDYGLLIDLITAKYVGDTNIYLFEYTYVISTIAGGFIAWIFLVFCFDIAVRTVKLSFLQLIAPIPIISYVDPKSSKGGMFQKWVKTCLSTYADLFIRLVAIYFAIYIIKIVSDSNQVYYSYGEGNPEGIIYVFIIVGALMFAKQVPKLIEDITGIKLSGKFELNPLKKFQENALGGKQIVGAAKGLGAGALGFAGGFAANAIANRGNWKGKGFKNALGNVGSMVAGGFSGGTRGMFSKDKNLFKAASAGIKGSVDARNLRDKRQATGDGGVDGFMRRRGEDILNFSGIESGASKFDKEISAYNAIEQQASDILSNANKEMVKYDGLSFKDSAGNAVTMNDLKLAKERLTALRSQDTSGMSSRQFNDHIQEINNLQNSIVRTEKLAEQAYVDEVMAGRIDDVATKAKVEGLKRTISTSTYKDISNGSANSGTDIKNLKDRMIAAQAKAKNSTAYAQAQINKKNDAKR